MTSMQATWSYCQGIHRRPNTSKEVSWLGLEDGKDPRKGIALCVCVGGQQG